MKKETLSMLTACLAVCAAFAEAVTWTGEAGTSDWGTAANWSPAKVPTAADTVTIGTDGGEAVAVTSTGMGAFPLSLTLNAGSSVTATGEIKYDVASVIAGGSLTIKTDNYFAQQGGGAGKAVSLDGCALTVLKSDTYGFWRSGAPVLNFVTTSGKASTYTCKGTYDAQTLYNDLFAPGWFVVDGETLTSLDEFKSTFTVSTGTATDNGDASVDTTTLTLTRVTEWGLSATTLSGITASSATVSVTVSAVKESGATVVYVCGTDSAIADTLATAGTSLGAATKGEAYSFTKSDLAENTVYHYAVGILSGGEVKASRTGVFVPVASGVKVFSGTVSASASAAANWQDGVVPTGGETVLIAATCDWDKNIDVNATEAHLGSILVSLSAGGVLTTKQGNGLHVTGDLTLKGGSIVVETGSTLAYSGSLVVDGGTFTATTLSGTTVVNSGSLTAAGNMTLSAAGSLTVNGGTVSATGTFAMEGTLTMTGGTLTADAVTRGASSVLSLSGGSLTQTGTDKNFSILPNDVLSGGSVSGVRELNTRTEDDAYAIAVNGTAFTCQWFAPQRAVMFTFNSGSLTATSSNEGGFWSAGGGRIIVPASSTASFTFTGDKEDPYGYVSGKFKYGTSEDTITSEEFTANFATETVTGGVRIYLKNPATPQTGTVLVADDFEGTSHAWGGTASIVPGGPDDAPATGWPLATSDHKQVLAVSGVAERTVAGAEDKADTEVDFLVQVVRTEEELAIPEGYDAPQIAVGFTAAGELAVYCANGGTPGFVTVGGAYADEEWIRLTLVFDYAAGRCKVVVNGEDAVSAAGYRTQAVDETGGAWYTLATTATKITSLAVVGSTQVDDVVVKNEALETYNPFTIGGQSEINGAPASYYKENGISTDAGTNAAGLTVAEAYAAGVDYKAGEAFAITAGEGSAEAITLTFPGTWAADSYTIEYSADAPKADGTFANLTPATVTAAEGARGETSNRVTVAVPTIGESGGSVFFKVSR